MFESAAGGGRARAGASRLAAWAAACLLATLAGAAQPAHAGAAQPQTLRIAAAADLQPVLPHLLAGFESQTGIRAQAVYASSSTLASQILNGAPFDLFLSADFSFPEKVIAGGRAQERHPIAYARGTLVLWARKNAPILRSGHPLSLDRLQDRSFGKLAIANPEHAPYGRAAVAAIRQMGLWSQLQPKLVIAENIAQAAQFVQSGNAEAGILSLTSAVTPRLRAIGTYVLLPRASYPPILQGAVIVRDAQGGREAQRFLKFLRSQPVERRLAELGLQAP